MSNMAKQLALYLQGKGEGALGTDLFVDSESPSMNEAVTICHVGGGAESRLDAPGSWRKLSLLARSASPEGAQERIWRIIARLLEPEGGVIDMDGGLYTVHITALPAVQPLDAEGRCSMRAVLLLKQVKPVVESWLEAISQYTQSALGGQWRVYRGFNGTAARRSRGSAQAGIAQQCQEALLSCPSSSSDKLPPGRPANTSWQRNC
ncbi:minor capsid protein [Paenibacillus aceris]|uniref:Uncharacterized protein n=1 Tax=Paenibacillus aceris TaxID=869555 RepID=A0ABS4I845_9BACL|nr:minor capsid protein [Paenibacillus aceris]MBP1967092.1 hypothetical protein [Paenibacillus aceris]NHW33285.1 hypothetical protein [Paenibacillus aceris]